ncbi:MAG: zinc ribbon domain-containing protein [Actinobacteria bacterium]|nr:zinc ribbon domain-containing protein [Actinomycetota bacterium]
MATYEFTCAECGPFEERRPMTAAAEPASCPHCGVSARRVYGGFHTTAVATPSRQAGEREERSREAPARTSAAPAAPTHAHHHHAPSRPWAVGH